MYCSCLMVLGMCQQRLARLHSFLGGCAFGLHREGLGSRVEGLGSRVKGLGSRAKGLGLRLEMVAWGSGFRKQDLCCCCISARV